MVAGCTAADVHRAGVAHLTVGLDDVQAGDLPLQGTGDVVVRAVGDHIAVKVLDRTYKLGLFQGTVTDDDGRFQRLGILVENEIDPGTVVDTLLDGLIAEELADKDAVPRSLDR